MPLLNPSPGTFSRARPLHITIHQPADVVTPLYTVRFVNGRASLTWNKNFKPKWEEKHVTVQEYMDSQVLNDCEPYVPYDTGLLVFSGKVSTKIGSGLVTWTTPYARYQYYGRVFVPSPFGGPNIRTNRRLRYHGGGKRGSFWFERAKQVHKDAWINGAREIMARGQT